MGFGQTFFSLPNAALQATIPFQSKKNYLVDLHKLFSGSLNCIRLRGEIKQSWLIENQRVKLDLHKLFCGSLSCIRLRGEIRTILANRKPTKGSMETASKV